MNDISNSNFGLLIAYALPGFVVVWSIQHLFQPAGVCTEVACSTGSSIFSFLNITVAAIAAGMAVSAVRYVLIDSIHSLLGLKRPQTDGASLQHNLNAVTTSVEQHYRYYQFHANMLIAGVIAVVARQEGIVTHPTAVPLVLITLAGIFWLAARDNLTKYYRTISTIASPYIEASPMSNGMHHEHEPPKRRPQPQDSQDKPPRKDRQTGDPQDSQPAPEQAPTQKS